MGHPLEIAGLTPEELAKQVANLRYDALRDFCEALAAQLHEDSEADLKRGRMKLSESLYDAYLASALVGRAVERAWEISEPHMKSV